MYRAVGKKGWFSLATTFLALALWSIVQVYADAADYGVQRPARPDSEPCKATKFEGDDFKVCRYAAGVDEIRLEWRGRTGPLGSLAALQSWLGTDASRVAFAMNAGMYDPTQRPVGLFVEKGQLAQPLDRRAGSGNFFLLPNGVFWVDGKGGPHIDETSVFAARDVHPLWATQSGPLLINSGALHASIAENGTSLAVRNGVGVRGREALFIISDVPVSFGRFARFLRDGLGCQDALYFDGVVSSLWVPALGRRDERTGLGTFVVVMHAKKTNPRH
jgi:uncharacterized protein YigE (DUF2233 family)